MDKIENFIDRFILFEIVESGFIFLSDELIFPNKVIDDFIESLSFNSVKNIRILYTKNKSGRLAAIREIIEQVRNNNSFANDEVGRDDIIAILEYQIFLDENGYDNRFKKKIKDIIISYIKASYPNIAIILDKYLYDPNIVEINFIASISDFAQFNANNFSKFDNVFFRGHANIAWKPLPSIYRNNWYQNEHKMFREIIIRNSEEFVNTKSTFEKLTIMQHYGLPTRLLDITKNPLVALYFSCCDKNENQSPGEVLIFVPEENEIKYYDSDTVSILANLSKCERTLETNMTKAKFNKKYDQGLKLLHLIKEEKPYFLNIIDPLDFNKALVVRPINNNARIKKQSGYFFLFGIEDKISKPAEINSLYSKNNKRVRYFIDDIDKQNILKDLEGLGISSESLFPEIEKGTEYLKSKY